MLSSWPFTDQATLSRGKASTVAAGFRLSQQFDGLAHVVGLACLQGMLSPGARQCTFEECLTRIALFWVCSAALMHAIVVAEPDELG